MTIADVYDILDLAFEHELVFEDLNGVWRAAYDGEPLTTKMRCFLEDLGDRSTDQLLMEEIGQVLDGNDEEVDIGGEDD